MGEVFENSLNQTALIEKYAEYLNKEGLLVTWGHTLRKGDILSKQVKMEVEPGIAMCICAHNHPDAVAKVLAAACLNCYFHGIDVYYYDSSEGEETKKIVQEWINRGYTNLHYVGVKGFLLGDKLVAISKEEGLCKHYDYIWLAKDRTIVSKETMDAVTEHIVERPDAMYLEVFGDDAYPEMNIYRDGIRLYQKHSLGLTSIDTTIYRHDSFFADIEGLQNVLEVAASFPHFYLILKKLAEMENPKLCILRGNRISFYNVNTGKSGWEKKAFLVWKDRWIRVNELLPDCYAPYREQVIKYVASRSWLIGGTQRLQELKTEGVLTLEKLDDIKINWERVSDIPFEEVRRIAEG